MKLDIKLQETYDFVGQIFMSIKDKYEDIQGHIDDGLKLLDDFTQIKQEQQQGINELNELIVRYGNDDNF